MRRNLILAFLLLFLIPAAGHGADLDSPDQGTTSVSVCANAEASSVGIEIAACCKICHKGKKACGNSCIAKWKPCLKVPGCACNPHAVPGNAEPGA